MENNVLMLRQSPPPYQFIGVGILKDSSLMGVFPSTTINMISSSVGGMSKGKEIVEVPSLGPHEALYHSIQSTSYAYIDDQHLVALDPYHLPYWLDYPLPNLDYLVITFLSDESIMEVMCPNESLWEDH